MNDVIQKVREKYPDAYRDVDDLTLTDIIGEKFPQYLQNESFKRDYDAIQARSAEAGAMKTDRNKVFTSPEEPSVEQPTPRFDFNTALPATAPVPEAKPPVPFDGTDEERKNFEEVSAILKKNAPPLVAPEFHTTYTEPGEDINATPGEWAKQTVGSVLRGAGGVATGVVRGIATGKEAVDEFVPGMKYLPTAAWLVKPKTVREYTDKVGEWADKNLAPNEVEQLKNSWLATKIPNGIGSALGFLAGGAGGALVKAPAWIMSGTLGVLATYDEQFTDAKQHGASEEQALAAALASTPFGASEAVPMAKWITRVSKAAGVPVKRAIFETAKETLEEGLQEWFQQVGANLVAKGIYDPQRQLFEGVGEAFGVGGATGLFMSLLTQSIGHARMRKKPADVTAAEESHLPATAEVLAEIGAPAAPEVAPTEAPEPETPESLTKQLDLTVDPNSTKAATLVTPGSPQMIVPEGMESVDTKHGEVIFNPAKTTREAVLQAAEGKDFDGTLLGMSQAAKPEPVGNTVVQTTKDGVPVLDEVVEPTEEAIAKATEAHKAAVPGGETTVRTAEEILAERKEGDKTAPNETATPTTVAPQNVDSGTAVSPAPAPAETGKGIDDLPVLKAGIKTPGEAARLATKLDGGGIRLEKDGTYSVVGRVEQPKPQKEPWQMTRHEWATGGDAQFDIKNPAYKQAARAHRTFVERALAEGKEVPPAVFKDYLDLAPNNEPIPGEVLAERGDWRLTRAPVSEGKYAGKGLNYFHIESRQPGGTTWQVSSIHSEAGFQMDAEESAREKFESITTGQHRFSPDEEMDRLRKEFGDQPVDDALEQYWSERLELPNTTPTISAEKLAKERGEVLTPEKALARREEWRKQLEAVGDARRAENGNKIILSLFDRTGNWSAPFVAAGYDVRVIDLAIDDVDVMSIDREWLEDYDMTDIHGVLAANPCDDFAVSGARWWKDKDADGRTAASVKLAHHTLAIIEYLKPSFWALENPVGRLSELAELGPPLLQFHPHNYGDPYTKRTQLFGNFNPNLPQANVEPTEGSKIHKLRGDVPEQKLERSETPEGFAMAFAVANMEHGPAERVREIIEAQRKSHSEVPGGKKGFQPEDAKLDKRKLDEIRADIVKAQERIEQIDEHGLNPGDPAIALAGDATKAAEFSKQLLRNHIDFDTKLLAAKEQAASEKAAPKPKKTKPSIMDKAPPEGWTDADNVPLTEPTAEQQKPPTGAVFSKAEEERIAQEWNLAKSDQYSPFVNAAFRVKRAVSAFKAAGRWADLDSDGRKRWQRAKAELNAATSVLDAIRKQEAAAAKPSTPAAPAAKPGLKGLSETENARLEELKAKLRKKLGQVGSGPDPEIITIGAEMAGLYVKSGVRQFSEFARNVKNDLPEIWDSLKQHLKSIWEAAAVNNPEIDEPSRAEVSEVLQAIDKETAQAQPASGESTVGQSGTGASGVDVREPAGTGATTEPEQPTAPAPEPDEPASPATGGPVEGEPGNERGRSVRSGDSGTARAKRKSSTPERPSTDTDADSGTGENLPATRSVADRNHVLPTDQDFIPSGDKTKVRANLDAITLLKKLEAENRNPTPEEKTILAKYVGWGGLKEVFDEGKAAYRDRPPWNEDQRKEYANWEKQWGKLYDEVGEVLSPDEHRTAARSILNAHYTSREVINGVWQAVKRLGFKGGKALEPSAGVGNFIGLTPEEVRAKTKWTAVELDSVSGRILGKLYPEARTHQMGFEDAKIAPNSQDLVITNVPFDAEGPRDKRYPSMSLHNYFIARALDVVKPGGIVAVITSDSTMDNSGAGRKAREYFAEQADLVGAVRLPNNAFKKNAGTEVTTDLLFFRKHDGTPFSGEGFKSVVDAETYKHEPIEINEYFAAHPEMMLGRMSLEGTMYGPAQQALIPTPGADLVQQLVTVIKHLPEHVMAQSGATTAPEAKVELAAQGTKIGALTLRDGVPMVAEPDGSLSKPEWAGNSAKAAQAKKYIALREVTRTAIGRMLDPNSTDADIAADRKTLNTEYDAYVKKYGPINERGSSFLDDDVDFPLLLALEDANTTVVESGGKTKRVTTWTKSKLFTERTIFPRVAPEHVDTVPDAVQVSQNFLGKVDPEYIARLTSRPTDSVIKELEETGQAFENPKTGQWENRSTFLSGFVKQKLTAARNAAQSDPRFNRHVEELEKVQPPPIAIENIGARLGSTWVPTEVIEKFISETLQVNARVHFTPETGNWHVAAISGQSGERNKTQFGIHDWKGHELVESALNLKSPVVTELVPADGGGTKEQKNQTKSLEAAEKQNGLQREFKKFILSDPVTARALENIYNENFNGVVAPKFEAPTWAHYPGASSDITLRDHQKAVVTRMVQNSTLLAHAVGTGKTYAMTTAAMEMRRLGLARKPMIVVQNATLEQFARAFKRLYPTARILAPNAKMRDAKNRNKTMARIATGEWDCVIIPQSFVNMLPDNPDRETKYIQDRLDELEAAQIEAAHEGGKRSPKASDLQKAIKRLEERLESLADRKKDNVLTFEQLGVDALFVDEAHAYKKLEFTTQMDNIKGLDKGYSQRGFSMFMKTRWVQEKNQGRNVIFATGTPVSNTIAEAWNMMRYVRPDVLKHYGIENFDSFASTFGDTQTKLEMTAGGTWKPVTRFARFTNGPELVAAWRTVADVVTPEEINLPGLPALKNGKPTIHVIKQTPALTKYIEYIRSELQRFADMTGKQKRDNSHIPLVMFGLAKKASLDMRMIDPELPDQPGSKLNVAADEVARVHLESTPVKGTQMVFSDAFQDNPDTPRFNLYNELKSKLIERGIPADEIVIITADIKDAKKDALFQKVIAGEVRVLIGSTERMGVGVNVQEKLIALHHLDAPPRPMDIEQRNGRIIRQGNTNLEVEVHSYGVENSLDAAMFDKLATKQKFINQILRGDLQGRNFEDAANEISLSFEEQMAAFSGDKRAMEKVGLENQVRQLEMLRSGHIEQVRKSRETIEQLTKRTIPFQEKTLADTKARAETFDKAFAADKDYTLTVGERTVTGRKEVAEAMDHVLKQGIETTVKNAKREAHFGSFTVELSPVTLNGQKILLSGKAIGDVKGVIDAERVSVDWAFEDGGAGGRSTTGVGFLHSLAATLERIADEPKRTVASLANEQRNLRELEGFVKQPFERDAELAQARETLAKLEAELKAEGEAKPAPAPEADTGEEGEEDEGDDGAAGATTGAPLAPAASAVTLTPKSQRQIITDLAKGLNVPVRFGRLRTNKFAGYFLRLQNLIGAKKANNIPIVSHEAGHKLDAMFSFSSDPAVQAELMTLGDPATPGSMSSMTPSKTVKYQLAEGVAEFVRYWLTDPLHAVTAAPLMHAAFEAALNANKDVGDVMRTTQNDIDTWRRAEPQARLRSHISVGSNPNKTPYTFKQLTRDVVDDLHFLRLAVDDAEKAGVNLPPSQNPYLLARTLRGSYGMADSFIRNGVANFDSKKVQLGTSLEDALKPVAGRLNDFRDWIVAKRAQELHAQGRETGLIDGDVNVTAARFDGDTAFQEAFTKVKAWNDALLQYAVDSGLVTEEGAEAMRQMNQDYVPFHRVFEVGAGEAPATAGGGVGRGLNVGKPGSLKRLEGSAREIVDPLETMVRNAYALITASEKHAINQAVADLSNQPDMGRWVEHIKTPQQQVTVGVEKLRKQLEAAGADLTLVPDDLMLQFFQNSGIAPFGENVIKIVRNGKPQFYRLDRDLFATFHALDNDDADTLLKMLSSPAQLLRSGVTLAPDFALANAIRDAFSSAIVSRYGLLPFEAVIRGVKALAKNPELVAQWEAAGGKNSVEASYFDREKTQKFLAERISKDFTPAERAWIALKSPLQALRWLTSISEEATRIGEFQKVRDALIKSGLPEGEAARMAAFESRDRQDFSKGGAKMKPLRRLTAFWNAALQGNVRLAQAFKERPIQTTLKGIAFITIPKLIEQWINWDDDDYWDRPQWERDLFFLFPIGKDAQGHTRFLRVPTPFEAGIIFGTLPGRILQAHKQHSGGALKSFPLLMAQNAIPNPMPQFATVLFELMPDKGWDVFRGRQIVPDRVAQLPSNMQWTEQTSLTARNVGKLIGVSPMKVDHLINSTTGGVGKQSTHQVVDRAIALATGEEKTAHGIVPGGRFLTTPAAVASQSIEDFYKTLGEIKTARAGQKKDGQPNDLVRWGPRFLATERRMSALRKQMRGAATEKERDAAGEQILTIARQTMAEFRKQQKR